MPVGLTLIKVGWFRGATCRGGSNRNKSSMSPTLLAFDLMKSLAAPAVKREPREEGAVLPGPHPRELKPPVSRGSEPRLAHKSRRGSPCRTAGSGRSPGTRGVDVNVGLVVAVRIRVSCTTLGSVAFEIWNEPLRIEAIEDDLRL
jgi:hypothetical protein